jgi:betaine-aldehyde dehydrogenase
MSTKEKAVRGAELPRIHEDLFIGGGWRAATGNARFAVVSPSSEEQIANVASASESDIDAAVSAARAQVDGGEWSRLSGADRGLLLSRLADLIERDAEILVALEAHDVGKPAF